MESHNRQAFVGSGKQQGGEKPSDADVPRDGDTLFEMPDRPTDDQLLQNLLNKIELKRPREPKQKRSKTPRSIRPSAELYGKKLLGRGGLGSVYRYHDRELGRDLAMKVCQHHILLSRNGIERFIRERRITARLAHPSIPPVHHCGELKDGRPYYVMRLIRGRSLQRLLQQRKSTPSDYRRDRGVSRMLDAFERVCDAVQYAHDAKVIHRDIKPANIILEKNGAAFLVDWGLARESVTAVTEPQSHEVDGEPASPTLTQSAVRIGSPDYMAPEQAEGNVDQHGPATDVYGLGATLYHILTGVAPHASSRPNGSESRDEMYARIATIAPPPANSLAAKCPAAVASICGKAMQRKPSDRYESARALRDDLVRWRRNELVLAHVDRYSLTHKFQLFAARHRSLVTTIVASFGILLLISIASAGVIARANFNLNEANKQLTEEQHSLELSAQIGFTMLRGIESEKFRSLNDVYVDVLQNGLRLPDEERAAMLPLYRALTSMQKADDHLTRSAEKNFSVLNLIGIKKLHLVNAKAEIESALAFLDESIARCDKIGLAWLLRAQIRMEYLREPYEEVIDDWDRAVELLPKSSAALSGRGWCLIRVSRLEQAMEDLVDAIEADPANEFAHRGIGEIYYDQKNFNASLDHYYMALALPQRYNTDEKWREVLFKDIATTHWARALDRSNDGDIDGTVKDFLDALKYCNPEDRPDLWANLAVMITGYQIGTSFAEGIGSLYTVWESEGQRASFEMTRKCTELLVRWRFGSLAVADVHELIEMLEELGDAATLEVTPLFLECLQEIEKDEDFDGDKLDTIRHLIRLIQRRSER